jgi:hypothetical protein
MFRQLRLTERDWRFPAAAAKRMFGGFPKKQVFPASRKAC